MKDLITSIAFLTLAIMLCFDLEPSAPFHLYALNTANVIIWLVNLICDIKKL